MSIPRVPRALAIVRALELWVVLPFALAAGTVGAAIIAGLLSHGGPFSHVGPVGELQLSVAGIVTGALTWCALRLALWAKTPLGVAVGTVVGCVLFAVINTSACFLAVTLAGREATVIEAVPVALLAGLVGLPFSVPLGVLWAVTFVGPMSVVAGLRRRPSLDGPDRALQVAGATLAVFCGFGYLVAQPFDVMPRVLSGLALAGALAMLVAMARLAWHARFLRRVRLGVLDEWAIVDPADLPDVPDDLPVTDARGSSEGVLVRRVTVAGEGAYRTGGVTHVAWARTAR